MPTLHVLRMESRFSEKHGDGWWNDGRYRDYDMEAVIQNKRT